MTGFELQTSGIGRDRSSNWATTTAEDREMLSKVILLHQKDPANFFGANFLLYKVSDTIFHSFFIYFSSFVPRSMQCDQIGHFIALWAFF